MGNKKCFWLDETHQTPTGFTVNIVTENEDGYETSGTIIETNDFGYAKAVVNLLNEKLFGIAPAEALRIVLTSMYPSARS